MDTRAPTGQPSFPNYDWPVPNDPSTGSVQQTQRPAPVQQQPSQSYKSEWDPNSGGQGHHMWGPDSLP